MAHSYSQFISQYWGPSETKRDLLLLFDHLPTHQRHRDISHFLKSRVSSLPCQQTLNKWLNPFASTTFSLIASTGFFPVKMVTSLFKAEPTSGSPFTHSVDLFPYLKLISWLHWKVKRRSPKAPLNHSTVPWSLLKFTFPLLILTSCSATSLVTSPVNSRPGSTCRTFGHLDGPRL